MLSKLMRAGATAAMLVGGVSAHAALCNPSPFDSKLIICFGENNSPNGAVSGDPLAARNAFDGYLKNIGVETFTGQSPGIPNLPPDESPIPLDFGNGILGTMIGRTTDDEAGTTVSHVFVVGTDNPVPSQGRFGTTGDGDAERFVEGSNTFEIQFRQAVSAFGFYGTDIGDFGGALSFDLLNANGATIATIPMVTTVTPGTDDSAGGSLLFWGFVDLEKQYSGVRFNFSSTRDGMGFDDLVTGFLNDQPPPNPTPEPGMLALLGIAGLAASVARRRRDRRAD